MKLNLSIKSALFGFTIGVLLLVTVTHGLLFVLMQRHMAEASDFTAKMISENTARGISNLIAELSQSLSMQASDQRLAEIMATGDPSAIQLEEDRLTRGLRQAWLVRLLPVSVDNPEENRSPRMGFSDLDLVRRAVTEETGPIVNLVNSPDGHLAMARRLLNGSGIIHVSWPTKLLDALVTAEGVCGMQLQQENVGFAYRGEAACRDKSPSGEVPVAGTPWKLVYWASAANTNAGWFVSALLASLVLIGGFAALILKRLNAALADDRGAMVSLISDLQSGYSFGNYRFKLAEFENLAGESSKLSRITRDKRRSESKHSSLGQPVVGKTANPAEKVGTVAQDEIAKDDEPQSDVSVSPKIFRAYDILGVNGETLTSEVAYTIGLAIGSEMCARGNIKVVVAHDGRVSSPELAEALSKGLVDAGRTVINIGLAPSPLLHFAANELNLRSSVMVTGSHYPPNFNGFKIIIDGDYTLETDIPSLRRRIEKNDFVTGSGKTENYRPTGEYVERMLGDIQPGRNLKIVLDCGNGAVSRVAPELFRSLGCEVVELFCDIDGNFPGHLPEPSNPENLEQLIDKVLESGADLGVAFDGDGDRVGMVDSRGKIIWPDRQMMMFAADVLSREPGADVIYDLNCSRHLPGQIVKNGGRPLMWRTGHSAIKEKMNETGAMLAGEMSGRIFFKERWLGTADGMYACARMIEILSNIMEATADVFARLPDSVTTPEMEIPITESEGIDFIEKLKACIDFPNIRINEIQGLRVDFTDGWGLVRLSKNSTALKVRFDGDTERALAKVQQKMIHVLRKVKPDLRLSGSYEEPMDNTQIS